MSESVYTVTLADAATREIIWSESYDEREIVAGMLAVGVGLIADLDFRTHNAHYILESNTDVSDYRVQASVPQERVSRNSCGITGDDYGIWMRSAYAGHYDLYRFASTLFLQGVISLATAFRVDFRDYLLGLPFDQVGNRYTLADYIMSSYQVTVDAIELDDVEEEERDDENIIVPLNKDY
jgi:hypothetical protein